jgi:phosphate-selective porin
VNWYVNEVVKLSANYLMTSTDDDTVKLQGLPTGRFAAGDDDDSGNAISLRAQYAF